MDARKLSRTLFRIVYSSSYTFFFIVLLILLCATPGDQIYQTIGNHKIGNVPVVGGTYFVTLIIASFIYASRLYTSRAALSAIPKPYLPIEQGEIGKNVRKMIVKNRQRSALIAWESRPRDLSGEKRSLTFKNEGLPNSPTLPRVNTKRKAQPGDNLIDFDPEFPPWGEIVNPGWSSPSSRDFPDLHFDTVLAELPNLIEAKVVSLAPHDPAFDFMSLGDGRMQAPPDPQIVALLQRQRYQTLRDYVTYLNSIRLINPPSLAEDFIARYEYARFSTIPLEEHEFRELMAVFSELLVNMESLDIRALEDTASQSSSDAASMSSVIYGRPVLKREASTASSFQSSSSVIHHSFADSIG